MRTESRYTSTHTNTRAYTNCHIYIRREKFMRKMGFSDNYEIHALLGSYRLHRLYNEMQNVLKFKTTIASCSIMYFLKRKLERRRNYGRNFFIIVFVPFFCLMHTKYIQRLLTWLPNFF